MEGKIPFQLTWTGKTGAQPQSWPRNKYMAECDLRSWSLINRNMKIASVYCSNIIYLTLVDA